MNELIGFFSGAFVAFFGLLFWNMKKSQGKLIKKPELTKKEKEQIEKSSDQELLDKFNKNRGKDD